MPKRHKIYSGRMSFKGDDARRLLCTLSSDEQLKQAFENPDLAPEMKSAVLAEMARRELLPDNYQI